MRSEILLVNFNSDDFQMAVAKKISENFSAVQWSHYESKENRSLAPSPFQPLVRLHLEAVRGIPKGPNLGVGVWPFGLPQEQVRAAELCCDRVFPSPLCRADAVAYLSLLWAGIKDEIDDSSFGRVLFAHTPHVPWDALLSLNFAQKGIPSFAIRGTQLTNRAVVARLPFDYLSGTFEKRGRDDPSSRVSVDTILIDTPRLAFAKALNEQASTSVMRFSLFQPIRLMRSLAKSAWRSSRKEAIKGGQEKRKVGRNTVPGRDFHYWSFIGRSTFIWLRLLSVVHGFQLSREAAGCASDPKGKFVYFPLHYQPEQNTDPESGHFRFQVAAVRELRRILDENGLSELEIVVKEHPRQTLDSSDVRLRNVRPLGFYKAITDIPRVVLSRPSISSSWLIEKSELVVTTSGSGAWEAVRIGKPAMTLATTWHSGCAAAPSLSTLRSEGRSISDLLKMGTEEVRSSVEAFVQTETITIPGVPKRLFADLSFNPHLADEMAESIVSLLR